MSSASQLEILFNPSECLYHIHPHRNAEPKHNQNHVLTQNAGLFF